MDYSKKYNISPSTLRRKIKGNTIKHKQESGKYYIYDTNEDNVQNLDTNDVYQNEVNIDMAQDHANQELIAFAEKSIATINSLNQNLLAEKDKRLNLQEQLIRELKEEISELKMLVKILEDKAKGSF
jgi:hypothetical protein